MQRVSELNDLDQAFRATKIVALLGPRQCGKTTLAHHYFKKNKGTADHYFDLENPHDLARLSDPLLALESLKSLIVIDEIQRVPDLFPVLRVLVDRKTPKQRYLILGSASRELIRQSSESLAGRIHYRELTPFSYPEASDLKKLWIRGGFPLSYLAHNIKESTQWRLDYIRTFLEQDIPALGITIPAAKLRRFWMMLAHYHGQLMNASELGNALDVSHHTIQKYLDILSGTFMVRQLHPWHANIAKRQVKTKKIYFRDSGIFHSLMNIPDQKALFTHPKIGASWEGFALESVIRHCNADAQDCYFWGVHGVGELDLLIARSSEFTGFEFKFSKTPTITRAMQQAIDSLKLKKLTIIYPGEHLIRLSSTITAVGLETFLKNKKI